MHDEARISARGRFSIRLADFRFDWLIFDSIGAEMLDLEEAIGEEDDE